VLAQAALFTCVARGFGSARLIRDLAIGLSLGVAVFLFFVKFLNVSLPAGWLAPILGAAGI
jgi:putative tricarboxylic transport membrane protein